MKFILLLCLTSLLFSCEDVQRDGISDLTDDQQDYIRNMGQKDCERQTKDDIADFKEEVNRFQDYDEGNFWTYTRKKGSSTLTTIKIYVWKVDGDKLYLLAINTDESGSAKHKFFKVTRAEHIRMLDDVQQKICDRLTYKEVEGSTSASKINLKYKSTETSTVPNKFEVTTVYSFTPKRPVFFANYHFDQNKVEEDEDGDSTGKTEKYVGSMTSRSEGEEFPDNGDSESDYSPREYCTIPAGTSYTFPYSLTNCSTTKPTDW